MDNTVLVEQTGGVATITLNRPESLNALNLELGDELLTVVDKVSHDPEVRSVVITGAGRAFCSGGDLHFFKNWKGPKHEAFGVLTHRLNRIIMDLRRMPKPVIAAINGVASGAGFSIAMACDLRIASNKAKFKQAYTTVGLVPDGGWTLFIARQIGFARTNELLLLDSILNANDVLNLGLVNQVVPAEDLTSVSKNLAEEIASKPSAAFARAKSLINQSIGFGLEAQIENERESIMAAGDTVEFAERLSAFFEKHL